MGAAVSGGADSVALLTNLLELRDEIGIVLSVLHFNHQIRGAESDADEQFVRELADRHALPFVSETRDVNAYAAERRLSLETAARNVRYEFFTRLLVRDDLNKIATGHTLDDQAETVLQKLARGAGTRGLAGIYPKITVSTERDHPAAIVRPLLATGRSEILEYLRDVKHCWREDTSNNDVRHARNRIRHKVLPLLQQEVNPRTRENLAEAGEIFRAEEEYWEQATNTLLPKLWSLHDAGGRINQVALQQQPLAIQRRLVRAAAASLGLSLEFRHVQEVLGLAGEGAQTALPNGWLAAVKKSEIAFERDAADSADYEYILAVPGKVIAAEVGTVIETVVVKTGERDSVVTLDRALVKEKLTVRNWRPGDRFWPAHTKEPKKIKELLQDRHITGDEKRRWPVIAIGGEVAWMRGFGVRRDFQAKNGAGVLITELPLDSAE